MVLMCEFREVNLQFNSKGTCNANTNPILRWEFETLQHKPQLKGHADYETVKRKASQGALQSKNPTLNLNLNLTGHKAIQEVLQAQNEERQKVERKKIEPEWTTSDSYHNPDTERSRETMESRVRASILNSIQS